MYNQRKHFHRFRRYTYNEPTCWFDNGYIYIEGSNLDNIESIYVTGNIDPEGYADGEDDVTIPGWMIPDIKKAIMTNFLHLSNMITICWYYESREPLILYCQTLLSLSIRVRIVSSEPTE